MKVNLKNFVLLIGIPAFLYACNTSEDSDITENVNSTSVLDSKDLVFNGDDCQNVLIHNGFTYGACGNELLIKELSSKRRNTINTQGNDIAIDAKLNLLFIQSRSEIKMYDLKSDQLNPVLIQSVPFRFGSFVGTDAANGVLVVSGGTSNTSVFRYTRTQMTLATTSIPVVDQRTGAPDVLVTETNQGARAFYSQDLGSVRTWGIQIVDFNRRGIVTNTRNVVRLSSGSFFSSATSRNSAPSNFPVEAEFLNNKLYVANFAAQGIEVVNVANNQLEATINLSFEPTNIATNGKLLFAIGSGSQTLAIIDPKTNEARELTFPGEDALEIPTGIAADGNYLTIADRNKGLIVMRLSELLQ